MKNAPGQLAETLGGSASGGIIGPPSASGAIPGGSGRVEIETRRHLISSAHFAGRIRNGAKAADLPIKQPHRFGLAVKRKTAPAPGLKIPYESLIAATEVIE